MVPAAECSLNRNILNTEQHCLFWTWNCGENKCGICFNCYLGPIGSCWRSAFPVDILRRSGLSCYRSWQIVGKISLYFHRTNVARVLCVSVKWRSLRAVSVVAEGELLHTKTKHQNTFRYLKLECLNTGAGTHLTC